MSVARGLETFKFSGINWIAGRKTKLLHALDPQKSAVVAEPLVRETLLCSKLHMPPR